jgi:hypothetical protein
MNIKQLGKTVRRSIFVIAICIFTFSCASSRLDLSLDFYVEPEEKTISQNGVLGVDEFIDLRPQLTTSEAKKWMGFVPGVLWLEFVSDIPDTYTGFSAYNSAPFRMNVAHAIYKDIEKNMVFDKVIFLPKDKYAKIDYRFEGILNKTFLKETGYYYGSGFYAWITRIIGLPYVSYEFELDVTLRIRDVKSNNIVWSYDLKGTRIDKFYNIYQLNSGKDNKHIISYNFSKIIESEMPNILKSIREALDAKK